MIEPTLADLQASVQDRLAFNSLADYVTLCSSYLALLERTHPTRIVSQPILTTFFISMMKHIAIALPDRSTLTFLSRIRKAFLMHLVGVSIFSKN